MDETRLYLAVGNWGDDPDVVTTLLGLPPTRFWRRGDQRPTGSPLGVKHELWALDSPAGPQVPFEESLEALLALLEQHAAGVREAVRRFGVVLQCASHFETSNPGFSLSPAIVMRVAALGLGFDFDLYVLPDSEASPTGPA